MTRNSIPLGHPNTRDPKLKKIVAFVLIAVIAIPGSLILVNSDSPDSNQLPIGVKAGAMSGWTNDLQVYGGGGRDASPTMVSSGDGVYVAFSRFDSGTGYRTITVMESMDGGVVWSQIGDFSPGPHDCVYPTMTVYNGALYVAFQFNLSATDHDIYCYESSAGAAGPWTQYSVRTDSNDDCRPAIGAVTIANYAGVYAVFENRRGGLNGTDLLVYKSTGGMFSYLNTAVGSGDAAEFTMADVSVYQDQNNPIIYLAFQRMSGGQNDIYFVRTLNGGSTWSNLYQVTSNPNDEYAPSISAYYFYLIISYVMWNGNPDVYAIVWTGSIFGNPHPISNTADIEGWPRVYNLWDNFYVFYSRGLNYTNGNLYMRSATGALNPTWGYSIMISDAGAAVDSEHHPGLALCDRPDANLYFSTAWGDYRVGANDSDIYYSTQGCRYTVGTDPQGMAFEVDGVTYSSEQTFNWPAGFRHTLTAPAGAYPFVRWDDGTSQWYTQTITVTASASDVTPGMIAYYSAIPEFSALALPILGMICVILASRARRRRTTSVHDPSRFPGPP